METIVLDTSFIQSFIDPRDGLHSQARDYLLSLSKGTKFIIPFIVLVELIIGSEYSEEVYEFCGILTDGFEFNSRQDVSFIEQLDQQMRKSLKANDCLILAICKRCDAQLATFDNRLKKFADEIL